MTLFMTSGPRGGVAA